MENTLSHKSDQPLVSAVIPTRNRPDLVCRAVRSALAQTYRNIEVVVVVDGPDPATVASLRALGDARIRIVALEENVGGSEARNVGIREAHGEFVALLDDDDEWLPTKTEKQIYIAQRSSPCALIVCQYFVRKTDKAMRCFPSHFPRPEQAISEYMFASFSGFQTSTFLCRRDRFLQVPFTMGLACCQDLDWFLRVMTRADSEIKVAQEPLAIFHVPENRPSTSNRLGWKSRLKWGQSQRHLMTRRAYADFILRVCLEKMLSDGLTTLDALMISKEYFIVGRPTLSGCARFATCFVLPKAIRARLKGTRARRLALEGR